MYFLEISLVSTILLSYRQKIFLKRAIVLLLSVGGLIKFIAESAFTSDGIYYKLFYSACPYDILAGFISMFFITRSSLSFQNQEIFLKIILCPYIWIGIT